MTQFEKEVIDRLGRIETKLDTDYKTLHGNGQPGLVQKLARLEKDVQLLISEQRPGNPELGDRLQHLEELHKNQDKSKAALISWIGIAAALAGTVYSIFKH